MTIFFVEEHIGRCPALQVLWLSCSQTFAAAAPQQTFYILRQKLSVVLGELEDSRKKAMDRDALCKSQQRM